MARTSTFVNPLFGGAPEETRDRIERARRAYDVAKTRKSSWQAYARMLTRNNKLRVELTGGTPCTDGETIWLRVPIELGDQLTHERKFCGIRNPVTKRMYCGACDVFDGIDCTQYHEVSHITADSFQGMSEEELVIVLEDAIKLEANGKPDSARAKKLELQFKRQNPTTFVHAANIISPWLGVVLNGVEDARVNEAMRQARPGTAVMFQAQTNKIFEEGIEQADGTTTHWNEQPLNMQAVIGLYCKISGLDYSTWLASSVVEALDDPEIRDLTLRAQTARSIGTTFRMSLRFLEALRRLGFCLAEEDVEDDPEPEPEPSPQPDPNGEKGEESGEGGTGGEGGEGGEASDSSGRSSSTSSGGSNPSGGAKPDTDDTDEADSDDDGSTEAAGDGTDTDDDEADDESAGKADSDESEDDDSDGDSDGDSGESDDTETGSSSGAGKTDESDQSEDSGKSDAAPPSTPSDSSLEEFDDDGDSDGDLDDDGDAGDTEDDSDGWDGSNPEHVDGAAEAADKAEPSLPMGEPEEVAHGLAIFGRHNDDGSVDEGNSPEDADEIDRAVAQADYFDAVSHNVYGVNVHTEEMSGRAYRRTDRDTIKIPETILSPSLLRLRRAFQANARGSYDHDRTSGSVDPRVLGKRVLSDDYRWFRKKTEPGKRDYFVLIGLDVSGSTSRPGLIDLIKRAAFAKAELCSRLGVKFAVYAHTGDYSYEHSGLMLEIYEIKSPKDPWGPVAKRKLTSLKSVSANLDGHTMEFYRKVCERQSATDKILMYYTDGAMPMENYDEELEILQREIALLRRQQVTVVGVGIKNDDPAKHGLDTIRLDKIEDVPKVVTELEKRLKK